MPQYFYTAKSFEGDFKTGVLEAKDKKDLSKILHHEGYVLIRAETGIPEKTELSMYPYQYISIWDNTETIEYCIRNAYKR